MKKKKVLTIVFGFLYLSFIALSFAFSLHSADESTEDSGIITNVVIKVLNFITFNKVSFDYSLVSLLTRKLIGHFFCFFLIGLTGYVSYFLVFSSIKKAFIISIIVSIPIAFTSEALQLFSDGRSFQITDILIDYSGAWLAILICYLTFNFKALKS